MSTQRSPESVLAKMPGWEQASCRELPGGLSNRTYLVEACGNRAILKIDDQTRAAPYNSRKDEARIQTTAAGHDLASCVLYVDEHVYMSKYIDGQVWTQANLDDEQGIANLAQKLKALHAMPLTGRTFNATVAMRHYLSNIENLDSDTVRCCTEIVVSMRAAQNLCCCHNDLVVGNIIATPEIRFLDWEYACDNDPFFDLATVVAHHELSRGKADLLLNSYFEGGGARWRSQLTRQIELYNALHWLWLAARSEDFENQVELDAIAERL